MATLSPQPYKGTRDYYPEQKRIQNYIFETWKKTVEKFGYEEYAAPLLEPLEVYTAKSGQELATEQTYAFTDRGGRVVAIRPEMTPTISRMVAARQQQLGYPARLYSIANFMRYERPQRGREREFWQLNVDVFGADGVAAEAEIITLASRIMKAFGAKSSMYEIKVNNRKLINFMMAQYLGLDVAQAQLMTKLFDRKGKISPESFRDQAAEIFGSEVAPEGLKKISALLGAKSMADLPKEIRESQVVEEVKELFTLLAQAKVKNVVFDITLMRGLDYYTGTVFEVFDMYPENKRAMFGGGRYDGLVGLFGGDGMSAVGMAPGLTTTELFLRSHKLLPDFGSTTEAYVIVLGDTLPQALKFADDLRNEGVNVEVDITDRKIDKKIKTVVKKRIPHLIFIGEEEVKSEIYTFKDVDSAKEEKLSFARIVSTIKDRRKAGDDIEL